MRNMICGAWVVIMMSLIPLEARNEASYQEKAATQAEALLRAIRRGTLAEVRQLIYEHGETYAESLHSMPVLSAAVCRESLGRDNIEEIAKLLLDAGADANHIDTWGVPVLMHACEFGAEKMVRILLNAGAVVNTCDSRGQTALNLAAGQPVIEALLVANGGRKGCIQG
ncbi:hypothetical protein FACS1894126_2460 [Alphaproteobacteria bacterium]|nr:hypothetical protein FACS1894126_2460 [Alphaproteobacteria bacterium]